MDIQTRQEAKALGLKRYFTGLACKNGHIDERLVSNSTCMACGAEGSKRKSAVTKEKDIARKSAWYQARRSEEVLKRRRYYQENMERMKAWGTVYRAERKEEQAARRRAHYEANKSRYIAQVRARQMAQRQAMPSWADAEAIAAIYSKAALMSHATGVKYHVDHFYPLAGKNVCGLHVEGNLRIITAAENLSKTNKVPETCES